MTAVADEMVWMRHGESGGVAQLPTAAREAWEDKGWAECEAPVEPDPAMVEHVPMVVAIQGEHGPEVVLPEASSDDEESTRTDKSEE